MVKYRQNGNLLYTSTGSPSYPLRADTSFYSTGATITNAIISSGSGGGSSAQVHWLVTDHLGTPRMIVDQSGSLASTTRHDYLPFGEEMFAGTGSRTSSQGYLADSKRQKFTEKERDDETGLDYFGARYFASTQGRFTSVDPLSGEKSRPQSWNRYAYALHNPLKFIDPDGQRYVQRTLANGSIQYGWCDTEQCYNQAIDSKSKDYAGWTPVSFDETADYTFQVRSRNADEMWEGYVLRTNGTWGYSDASCSRCGGLITDWNAQLAIGSGISGLMGLADLGLAQGAAALATRGAATAGGEMVEGLYGKVSFEVVESAAKSGGPTMEVFTRLDQAPAAGKALHMAYQEAGTAARASGQLFKGQVPRALIDQLKRSGLAFEKTLQWKGAAGAVKTYTELQVMPQASRFIVPFLK